jgi:hypothetical protein
MIIDTVNDLGAPLILVCEHICSVHRSHTTGHWIVTLPNDNHVVTEQVAQGIIRVMRSMHNIREVLP